MRGAGQWRHPIFVYISPARHLLLLILVKRQVEA